MKSDVVLPDLWTDWCSVTATPFAQRDEATLTRFARQARPPQRMLAALRPGVETDRAPAWPRECRRSGSSALQQLIHRGSARINAPDLHWIIRLRMRRLLFAAVLIAPAGQGGLGLTRNRTLDLTPRRLQDLRPLVGSTEDETSCPACAVWSWLEVLGTNSGWSRSAVRALGYRRDDLSGTSHRHEHEDPNPDWSNWRGYSNLLPAIDRWGYIDMYASMHRSSLSVLISAIATMIATPVVPGTPPEPAPKQPARDITPEEEKLILARADELNSRITAILEECG